MRKCVKKETSSSKLIMIFATFPRERRQAIWEENKKKKCVLWHDGIEVTFHLSVLSSQAELTFPIIFTSLL